MARRREDESQSRSRPAWLVPVIAAVVVVSGCAVALLLVALSRSIPQAATARPVPQPVSAPIPAPAPVPVAPKTIDLKFGQEYASGDLRIKITAVRSDDCASQYYGQFTSRELTYAILSVTNTNKGKIAEWRGWQGKAKLSDEHGNTFGPADLRGWSWMPYNMPDGWDGDTGTRVFPGKTYQRRLFRVDSAHVEDGDSDRSHRGRHAAFLRPHRG